jgi:hypothetical protein
MNVSVQKLETLTVKTNENNVLTLTWSDVKTFVYKC